MYIPVIVFIVFNGVYDAEDDHHRAVGVFSYYGEKRSIKKKRKKDFVICTVLGHARKIILSTRLYIDYNLQVGILHTIMFRRAFEAQ